MGPWGKIKSMFENKYKVLKLTDLKESGQLFYT